MKMQKAKFCDLELWPSFLTHLVLFCSSFLWCSKFTLSIGKYQSYYLKKLNGLWNLYPSASGNHNYKWWDIARFRGGTGGQDSPGKSQVAICFFRNTGTDPSRETIGPFWSNCFSREVRTALCEICWWLKIKLSGSPPIKFSVYTHGKMRLNQNLIIKQDIG